LRQIALRYWLPCATTVLLLLHHWIEQCRRVDIAPLPDWSWRCVCLGPRVDRYGHITHGTASATEHSHVRGLRERGRPRARRSPERSRATAPESRHVRGWLPQATRSHVTGYRAGQNEMSRHHRKQRGSIVSFPRRRKQRPDGGRLLSRCRLPLPRFPGHFRGTSEASFFFR
jgi:hypothetical protein